MRVVLTRPFLRAVKPLVRSNPHLQVQIDRVLRQLEEDPWHPSLSTHKLKGPLSGFWACTASYDLRILFEFRTRPHTGEREIALVSCGSHDDVY